tara:strand:+ start:1266 stop:2144 length:879 start_codon:yes stop_codon:yes gene_type:complete
MKKLFCFGLGYTARALIADLHKQGGWQFAGTCRSAEKCQDMRLLNIEAHVFDGQTPLEPLWDRLAECTHLLVSIPPAPERGDPVLACHEQDLARLNHLHWVGYLSTTAVYGDRQGEWVYDDTPEAPTSARGRLRYAAEQSWRRLYQDHGLPLHIFRLGSIYGPGRGQLHSLLTGRLQKIIKPGQVFSRIHVDDIVQTLQASFARPHPGRSYNVVDDVPSSSPEVIDYICDLMDRPRLEGVDFDSAPLSPLMKSFYGENKKVDNTRLHKELGVTLKYPSYREGYKALVDQVRA